MYRVWLNRPWQCDIDNRKINKYEKMFFFLYKCDVNFVYLIQKMVFFFKRILSCGLHLLNYSLWVVWYSKTWANRLKCYWIRKATLTEAARCRISLQHTQTVTYGKNKKQNKTGYWYLLTAYGLSVNHSCHSRFTIY